MGGLPGIEMQKERTELSLGKAEETMIGIVIGAMRGTVAMTVTGIEIMTAPVALIRGEGNVLGPGSAAGTAERFYCVWFQRLVIIIGQSWRLIWFLGATRGIESVAPWLADSQGYFCLPAWQWWGFLRYIWWGCALYWRKSDSLVVFVDGLLSNPVILSSFLLWPDVVYQNILFYMLPTMYEFRVTQASLGPPIKFTCGSICNLLILWCIELIFFRLRF